MEDQDILESVKKELTNYLIEKKLRKTPERFAILEQIYSLKEHFDVDTLYELMLKSGYRVSRATVYNTIDLLVECRLIVRHQFGTNMAHYEKAFQNESHHHLICTQCNSVNEVKDDEIHDLIQSKKFNKFTLTNYNLYMYGICSKCAAANRKNTIHK
ncbi:MAG: Fur family transcriptional regulator [Bacteroidales bacterium]|nr:Fur family transcriptional regulator [Bacteroidales bacterium]